VYNILDSACNNWTFSIIFFSHIPDIQRAK